MIEHPAALRNDRLFDDMQHRLTAVVEPGAGKRKVRPRPGRESEDVVIEGDSLLGISREDGEMIHPIDRHGSLLPNARNEPAKFAAESAPPAAAVKSIVVKNRNLTPALRPTQAFGPWTSARTATSAFWLSAGSRRGSSRRSMTKCARRSAKTKRATSCGAPFAAQRSTR